MVARLARFMAVTFLAFSSLLGGQSEERVFPVFEELRSIDTTDLWPGFNHLEIPAAVFDGADTYLIHWLGQPDGFMPVDGSRGIYVYPGKHPQVLGNGRIQLDGIWVATSILRQRSPLTGVAYTPKHLAAILIHEMFHVYQKLQYPEWSPNEAVLFGYPHDTLERLSLRRLEMKSFLRALNSPDDSESRRWGAAALGYRNQRLASLGPTRRRYEDELQRFEGLAHYIERRAAGKSLETDDRYQDFAPGVIRDMGYLEGCWTAGLLDRFDPGWKGEMDRDPSLYLAERLSLVCSAVSPMSFSEEELRQIRETSRVDFGAWERERIRLRHQIENRPGYRINIDSEAFPLSLRMFFATHTEALQDGKSLHRRLFMARNPAGSLEVRRRDCLVSATGPSSILRVLIPGLSSEPEIVQVEDRISVEAEGLKLDFSPATLSTTGHTILIKLHEKMTNDK